MPTLPPVAADLPAGVATADLVWEETVAAGGYAAKQIARGTRLRLVDLYGDACASMLVFNAERPIERLNVADTVKVQWNAYLGAGSLLLSDMGRALFSILEDTTAGHDAFCGASNEASNARRFGDGANHGLHPNARDRLGLAVAKFGLGRKDIHPCINWFKPAKISIDGAVALDPGPFAAQRKVTLRAEMDVIVCVANCPHILDPRTDYAVRPLRLTAWKGPVTAADDTIRNSTLEALRAFLNVEDYYRR